jgi:GT2 family glycosyltransferase
MNRPASPVVSMILVNYNDRDHLEACLESLRPGPLSPGREIVLVDNASTDGSADFVAGRYPGVRLIRNAENVGFSRANNQAAREGRGDFLLFLNTDTVVSAEAVDVLMAEMDKAPRVGAAGPALLRSPGRFQVSFGRRVDFAAQFVQKMFVNPYQKVRLRRARKAREVGWLSAACLLCRREAFAAAGGFDESFFIYFEDIDLCFRMRKAGWRLLFVPQARVFHEGGATTVPRPARSRLEYRKSQVRFYEKHNSRTSLGLLRAYLRLVLAARRAAGRFGSPDGKALFNEYRRLLGRERRAG